ncbi:MAG: hypothetical protein CV087_09080 [Candidatus Brocadia sp. WS118]|nr:MAG: hypothetical protein CV087_09080 [Candidatus Brocadia sp. WS118]
MNDVSAKILNQERSLRARVGLQARVRWVLLLGAWGFGVYPSYAVVGNLNDIDRVSSFSRIISYGDFNQFSHTINNSHLPKFICMIIEPVFHFLRQASQWHQAFPIVTITWATCSAYFDSEWIMRKDIEIPYVKGNGITFYPSKYYRQRTTFVLDVFSPVVFRVMSFFISKNGLDVWNNILFKANNVFLQCAFRIERLIDYIWQIKTSVGVFVNSGVGKIIVTVIDSFYFAKQAVGDIPAFFPSAIGSDVNNPINSGNNDCCLADSASKGDKKKNTYEPLKYIRASMAWGGLTIWPNLRLDDYDFDVSYDGAKWFHLYRFPDSCYFESERLFKISPLLQDSMKYYSEKYREDYLIELGGTFSIHNLANIDFDISRDGAKWYHLFGDSCDSKIEKYVIDFTKSNTGLCGSGG